MFKKDPTLYSVADAAAKVIEASTLPITENAEQIDELSKNKLGDYVKKASDHKFGHGAAAVSNIVLNNPDDAKKSMSANKKRTDGIHKAIDRLTKEDVEQIDEIFPGTPEYEKKYGKVVQDVKKGQTKKTTKGEVVGTGKGVVHKRKFSEMVEAAIVKISTKKEIGTRVSDVGSDGKEHNVKTDAAWDAWDKKNEKKNEKKKFSEMLDVYVNGDVRSLLSIISEEPTNDQFTSELKKSQAKSQGKDVAHVAAADVQAVKTLKDNSDSDSSYNEEFTLEDFTLEEIEDFILSEEFEQLDEETQNQFVDYLESIDEQAKWRKGYSASGHPPGFKHKNGDIGPIGGTFTNAETGWDGETSKVPVNKYRDDRDELADRGTSKTGSTGKPLTKKYATSKLKYMIKNSLGKHAAPVGKLPEEFEQLDELSKETLKSYLDKQEKHDNDRMKENQKYLEKRRNLIKTGISKDSQQIKKLDASSDRNMYKVNKNDREFNGNKTTGTERAKERLSGVYHPKKNYHAESVNEEFEQLDELSKETLKSYYKKASSPYGKDGKPVNSANKLAKRIDGRLKVIDRLNSDNIKKEEVDLDEDYQSMKARLVKLQAQYNKILDSDKPNADRLRKIREQIIKLKFDLGESVEIDDELNLDESEQLDELNLKTLQTYRGKATEKLGHETKEKDDVRKAGIGRAGTKIKDKLSGVPFNPPYDDAKGTVTDKSGAKHDEYSRVRDLARKSIKEDLEAIAAKNRPVEEVVEPINETTYTVRHDGVPANHKDTTIRKMFADKKNVINHVTRYEQSAKDRAELLKKGGFLNVRIEGK